jgi:uncharacterized cupin superfamily protein
MPKIDVDKLPQRSGSGYPPPYAECAGSREKKALGQAAGLLDFGVNLTHLPPGAWSSQRHWHSAEDEFVYVLSGELVLITNEGEQILHAHECAAFPKNVANGHHLVNRGTAIAAYLEIGSRHDDDICSYPDIDLHLDGQAGYTHKDGRAY